MKALIADGKNPPRVREISPPSLTGPYDIICENLFCATCAGTDLHIIQGVFAFPVSYPTVIGHESVGRVVQAGERVRGFRVGDVVTRVGAAPVEDGLYAHWGGMSQYGLGKDHMAMRLDGLDPARYQAYTVNNRVPDGLIDPLDATMIITWRETLSYVSRMGIGPGARVLVSGSGANGFSIARMALLRGAAHVCMTGSGPRRETAERLGLSEYIDYKDEAALERYIRDNAHSLDFIIDATGKNGSLNQFLPCINTGGTVSCYGRDDYLSYSLPIFLAKASFKIYNGGYAEVEAHQDVLDLIRQNKLDAGAWLDREHIFPISKADGAYAHVAQKKAMKAVVSLKENA